MSHEKRLFLFLTLAFCSILGAQYLMELTGLTPPPVKNPPHVAKVPPAEKVPGPTTDEPTVIVRVKEKGAAEAEGTNPATKPQVVRVPAEDLIIGSAKDQAPDGYRLEIRLDQQGAGVASVSSSRYEAEFEEGKPRHRPF
jgi:hypothetical protein